MTFDNNIGSSCLLSSVNNSVAEDPSDWSFSMFAWPESLHTESPLSSSASAGVYQDASWNSFDQSFASIQNSIDKTFAPENSFLGCLPSDSQSTYINSSLQEANTSFLTLSAISESTQFDDIDGDSDETPRPGVCSSSSHSLATPTLVMQSRQPAWGISRGPRRNSTGTTKNHKRRKISDKETKSSGETVSG
ncbi:hypothetical protein BDZ45DRAFT_723816 [Acephala macrosclerotiorum]|nr:hypothetical protein BDZ45DRAFT_723816 [Acephala macrosclerotiorum]